MKKESVSKNKQSIQQKIDNLQQTFKSICLSLGEPLSYCYLFLRSLNRNSYANKAQQLKVKSYILLDEINLFKRSASFCQKMSILMTQREEIVRFLRSQLIINRKVKEPNLKSCCQKLEGIRIYTLTILQNLQNLVARLKVKNSEYVTQIIQKLVQGTDFLRFTALRRHIEFSNGDDPLFLIPLKKFKNLELASNYHKKSIINLFSIGQDYQIRLYNADRFLRGIDDEPEYKSLELKPMRDDFEYDEAIYEQSTKGKAKLLKPTKTIQKFMFPEIPAKKNMIKLKDPSHSSNLSNLIRKLINETQYEEKLKHNKRPNFDDIKRRVMTQAADYKQQDQSQVGSKFNAINRHRRLKTVELSSSQHDEQSTISRVNTLKNTTIPQTQQIPINQTRNISYFHLGTDLKIPQTVDRQHNQDYLSKLSNKNIKYQPTSKLDNDPNKRTHKLEEANKIEEKIYESINKIKKNNKRKKSAIKIIIEDRSKQTIYNEMSNRREEISSQNHNKKWFGNHKANRNIDFSPQVRQKISKIEQLSKIPIQHGKKDDNQSDRYNKRNSLREAEENQRYKNPLDQLVGITQSDSPKINTKSINKKNTPQKKSSSPNNDSKRMLQNKSVPKDPQLSTKLKEELHQMSRDQQFNSRIENPSKYTINNKNIEKPIISNTRKQNESNALPSKINPRPLGPQLTFQQIKQIPQQQKLRAKNAHQGMNEYLNSSNRVIFDKRPQQYERNNNDFNGISPQSKIREERGSIMQKCIFISKCIQQSQLLEQIKQFNNQSLRHIEPYLTSNYFKNRHLMLTNCVFKDQIASYCIYYPYMTKNSRFVFILHLQVKEKYAAVEGQLVSTFFKYIFCNDPTNKIIYLRHKQLFPQYFGEVLQGQSYFAGEIKTPIKGSQLTEKSYLFERKQLKCNKQLEYTSIVNTYFIFVTLATQLSISSPKVKNAYFSSIFLKKLQNSLRNKQTKNFLNFSQLSSYLQQQKLPQFTKCRYNNQIVMYSQFFEDCLINIRYFVYSKYFYFTIQPPYSYLYENDDIYYILLSTSVEKQYFILADKIYEQTQHIDLYQNFRTNVLNKKINDIFTQDKKRGTIISCPQFRKKVQVDFSSRGTGILHFSLNWKQYIKGVRYFPQNQVKIELIGPFFCGLVELDETNAITQIYSTIIEESDILK